MSALKNIRLMMASSTLLHDFLHVMLFIKLLNTVVSMLTISEWDCRTPHLHYSSSSMHNAAPRHAQMAK
jgi:hypothetical protein